MMLASGSPDEAGSSGEEPSSASLTRYEARQARSAELKNRRRITKALAAKRSRAQHGQYVSQLTEEAETLRGRIRELKRQRDPDSVAHAMLSEMTAAIPAAQAETLRSWIKASSLDALVGRAEAREWAEQQEEERARRADSAAMMEGDGMSSIGGSSVGPSPYLGGMSGGPSPACRGLSGGPSPGTGGPASLKETGRSKLTASP